MKINTVLSHDAEYIGDIQENRVGIDKSNLDFITTLLTSNLYSKPLESFFRETVANAYDSHVEAGTKEHILLLIEDTKEYKTYRISIRDYGTGVSPERFEKIYRNIGSSTKRESNDYIGMFGIGRFSCLSCADVAHITSYYKGVKYSYIMYKNGGGINIDRISATEGDYKDGLEVSIEKYIYSDTDFSNAINGLCLFDKVHITYKGENYYLKSIVGTFNERKLVHYQNFSYCSMLGPYTSYCKVGNVLYQGGIEGLDTKGIAIDLPIGSVDITPNREALQYTDYTKAAISRQAALVKKELQDLVNAQIVGDMTLAQFCTNFVFENSFVITKDADTPPLRISRSDVKLDTFQLTINGEVPPQGYTDFLTDIKYLEIPKELVHKAINKEMYQRRLYNQEAKDYITGRIDLIEKLDKVTKQVTMQYTLEKQKKSAVILSYEGLEKLKSGISQYLHNSVLVTKVNIKECIDFTFKNIPIKSMSNAAVPQSYIDDYRDVQKSKRKKIDTSETPIRIYSLYGYRQGTLSQLSKTGLVIYTSHTSHLSPDGSDKELRELAHLLYYTNSVAAVITIRKDYMKLIESSKRFVTVENFLYVRNKVLSRFVTSYIIEENFSAVFNTQYSYRTEVPIVKEYRKKYLREHNMRDDCRHTDLAQNIIKYYKERDWVNKVDINYFKLTDEEAIALSEWTALKERRYEIVRMVAFKKFGRMPKIGLTPIVAPMIPKN